MITSLEDMEVEELKATGNAAFLSGVHTLAVALSPPFPHNGRLLNFTIQLLLSRLQYLWSNGRAVKKAYSCAGQNERALHAFSEAMTACTSSTSVELRGALYSNRSAALYQLDRFEEALEDAEHALSLRPEWDKALVRKILALHGLRRISQASFAEQQTCRTAMSIGKVCRLLTQFHANRPWLWQRRVFSAFQTARPSRTHMRFC